MPEGVHSKVLRTTTELEEFVPDWHRLWLDDPQSTPFQRAEWLLPWWRHFGSSQLRAIQIFEDNRLLGFLPFYLYREPQTGERKLLLLGVGTTDYLDGVFSHQCTPQHICAGLNALLQDADWDALYVSQLRPQSPLFQALQIFGAERASKFESDFCSRMQAVSLSELPVKIRRNAMYYRNRAARSGDLRLQVADAQTWSTCWDGLVRLHTERWHSTGQSGVLADEKVLAWHQEALPLLQQAGLLRLCSLELDGELLAGVYSLIDAPQRFPRTQYFYITAYSVAHSDLRPGTLLIALTSESAQSEGVQIIDMLRGNEPYKQLWHLERSPTFGFRIAAAQIPAALAAAAQ